MGALYDYGRRLVVAEDEVEKLRDELRLYKGILFAHENMPSDFYFFVFRLNFFLLGDAAVMAETEKNSAISQISELEKELQFAKESNTELEQLKKSYKELETSGKAHDEELTWLLDPVAQGLSGNDSIISIHVSCFPFYVD